MTDTNTPPINPAQEAANRARDVQLGLMVNNAQRQNESMDAANRAGNQTTEFWLSLAAIVLGALAAVFSSNPYAQVGGIVAASLSAGVYSHGRAKIKSAP